MIILGVDPGASGGLAVISDSGISYSNPMPKTERGVWGLIRTWLGIKDVFCVIEKVGGYVGGKGNTGSSMFTFGKNVGLIHGFLIAADIPYEEVIPRTWQKAFSIAPRKSHKEGTKKVYDETKSQFKNRLKMKAQKLFPKLDINLKNCDSLLIAEYGRRKRTNTLG